MKKKILTIILAILLVFLIGTTIYKSKIFSKNNTSKNETNRDFMLNSNSAVNYRGENSGIYVGTTEGEGKENYLFISIKINKSVSKEEQAKALELLENNGNKIKVDFAKTSAPFVIKESVLDIEPSFFIISDFSVPKTIFDSINRTFKSYFGSETETYFSADSENINIENDVLPISIDMTQPY